MPPKAKKEPHKMSLHGDTRTDDYFWMKNRDEKNVLDHLKAENSYAASWLKQSKRLKAKMFKEMKGRQQKKDQSVPVFENGFYTYTKYNEKSEHPIFVRKKTSLKAKEETVLDSNKIAAGESFFSLGQTSISPDNKTLAYSVDTVGRRIYTIHFKDLESGETLKNSIKNVTGSMTWAEDNKTLFYSKQNPKTLRSEWIYSYDLKTGKTNLIYHEKDNKFFTFVFKTRTKKFIVIASGSSETSEYMLIEADKPSQKPMLFNKRKNGHKYDISHAGNFFYVTSNEKANNFKVMKTPNNSQTSSKNWKTVVPHRAKVFVESALPFKNHLVLNIRKNGVSEIEVMDLKTKKRQIVEQPEMSHMVGTRSNLSFENTSFRYVYSSMTTPETTIDYNLLTQEKTVRKVTKVLGGFDKNNYKSERLYATSHDGVKIPISIVYNKKTSLGSNTPLLLYGYGSYGYSIDPAFSTARLSLLNRGFVFAIAHIRGSSTMGRQWYLDGKYLKKKNTFKDFVSAADFLIAKKITSKKHLYAMGGSAGGLLMGAVVNMRPELFHGIVAQVPFVDVMTTMLDDSLPLTTNEYEEWGNPNVKKYYDYMKSYSPYDNIKKQSYPNMLIVSGYHDSQVQYWEPTKWVAKLRDYNSSANPILLDTNLEAGHGGKSGRFKRLEDTARDYAYLVNLEKNSN